MCGQLLLQLMAPASCCTTDPYPSPALFHCHPPYLTVCLPAPTNHLPACLVARPPARPARLPASPNWPSYPTALTTPACRTPAITQSVMEPLGGCSSHWQQASRARGVRGTRQCLYIALARMQCDVPPPRHLPATSQALVDQTNAA